MVRGHASHVFAGPVLVTRFEITRAMPGPAGANDIPATPQSLRVDSEIIATRNNLRLRYMQLTVIQRVNLINCMHSTLQIATYNTVTFRQRIRTIMIYMTPTVRPLTPFGSPKVMHNNFSTTVRKLRAFELIISNRKCTTKFFGFDFIHVYML